MVGRLLRAVRRPIASAAGDGLRAPARGCRSSRRRPGRRRCPRARRSAAGSSSPALVLDLDRRLRHHRQLGGLDREPGRLDRRAHRRQLSGALDDLEASSRRARRRPPRPRPPRASARPRRRRRRRRARRRGARTAMRPRPTRRGCRRSSRTRARTSDAVRLRLSVSASTIIATPPGAVALVDDRLVRRRVGVRRRSRARSRARCCPSASSTTAPSRSRSAARGSPPGSGPPSRAATMIARESFEKSLPALRVGGALLVLDRRPLAMPGHPSPPYQLQEPLVHARVVRQLRVERRDEEPPVAQSTGSPSCSASTSTPAPTSANARRADEDAAQRLVVARERRGRPRSSRPGARTRSARPRGRRARGGSRSRTIIPAHVPNIGPREPPDGLVEPVQAHQAHERRRLAAGDHEPVEPVELLRLAHLDDVRAEPAQHRRVLAKVALHCQNADRHAPRLQHEGAAVLVDRLSGDRPGVARERATRRCPRSPRAAPRGRAAPRASPRRAPPRASLESRRAPDTPCPSRPSPDRSRSRRRPEAPTRPRTIGRARGARPSTRCSRCSPARRCARGSRRSPPRAADPARPRASARTPARSCRCR